MAKQLHVLVRDDQYRFLRWESGRTDLSIAHLVRTALDNVYQPDFADIDAEFVPQARSSRPLEPDFTLTPGDPLEAGDPLEPGDPLEARDPLEPGDPLEARDPLEPG